MEINKLRSEVKILCDKIDALHPNDDFGLSDLWDELTLLFCRDQALTLIYFEECPDPNILSQLGSVIDYIALMLQSNEFVELVKKVAHRYEQFWGEYNWVVDSVERMIMPKGEAEALKKYKTPSAWEQRNSLLYQSINKLKSKISTLRELSTRRPLLAREQTELAFLEKIQAADSFDALEALDKELTNTATDPELKARLQKYVVEKMELY